MDHQQRLIDNKVHKKISLKLNTFHIKKTCILDIFYLKKSRREKEMIGSIL